MRADIDSIITALVFAVLGIAAGFILGHNVKSRPAEVVVESQVNRPLSGWEILTMAIIATESEFDSLAVSSDSLDRGILQIRQVYVDEANRILGIERFDHDDAFSVSKSLEMYGIIQEHYNAEHVMERTLKLHNPNAGPWYQRKVMRNFRKIVKYEEIRKQL